MQPTKSFKRLVASVPAQMQAAVAFAATMFSDRLQMAATAYSSQVTAVPGQTLIHRFGDHIQGAVYAGVVMILGAVMVVEAGNVVNYTTVDTIVTNLTDVLSTGSSLLILLILAIIFGFALFYLQFSGAGGRAAGNSGESRT